MCPAIRGRDPTATRKRIQLTIECAYEQHYDVVLGEADDDRIMFCMGGGVEVCDKCRR